MVKNFIYQMSVSGFYKKPIAILVAPSIKFWMAEKHHQDYIKHNPKSGYLQKVFYTGNKALSKAIPSTN